MQLDQIKDLEEITRKIEKHLSTSAEMSFNDFNIQLTNTIDIKSAEEAKKIRETLIEEEIINVDEEKQLITDIDKQKVLKETTTGKEKFFSEHFPVQAYQDYSKTKLAQEYSDWLIENLNLQPVWAKKSTIFFLYNPLNKIYEPIEKDKVFKKAKGDLKVNFTNHLKSELKNNIEYNPNDIDIDQLGLNQNQILLKDNQILNLKTKKLRKAEKEDYALAYFNAEYDPKAESDGLKQFIYETIDTEEMVKTFQEFLGFILKYPSSEYEKLLLFLGYTDTGKSTLLEVLENFINSENITTISFPQLGSDRGFMVHKLKNSILNIDHDMADQDIPSKHRIKKIVSKQRLTTEEKKKDGYEIKPKTNLIVASNHSPDDSGSKSAFYNRFLTITATNRVKEEDKVRNLSEKLSTQQNFNWLLQWALEGLERLENNNDFTFNPTEYETKQLWDKFGSSVQQFINEQVTHKPGLNNIPTTDVYEAYEKWVSNKLHQKVSRHEFISEASKHPDMAKRKAVTSSGSQRSCFIDIELKDYEY